MQVRRQPIQRPTARRASPSVLRIGQAGGDELPDRLRRVRRGPATAPPVAQAVQAHRVEAGDPQPHRPVGDPHVDLDRGHGLPWRASQQMRARSRTRASAVRLCASCAQLPLLLGGHRADRQGSDTGRLLQLAPYPIPSNDLPDGPLRNRFQECLHASEALALGQPMVDAGGTIQLTVPWATIKWMPPGRASAGNCPGARVPDPGAYCTVRVPVIPASLCPGTLQ